MFSKLHSTLFCLMGPTASGKSAAAIALASRWPIEIINVDSATIYQGMDIGTAKPSQAEQSQYTHHLLDIIDPKQTFSVGDFLKRTSPLVQAIYDRGHIPLLCGGTMMYFKALRDGIDDLPGADLALREQLSAQADEIGWPQMHERLRALDPETAQRLSPNDSQRIQRALEICLLTGGTMTERLKQSPQEPNRLDFINFSLEPSTRVGLHDRIHHRFDAMLTNGLIEEVARLKDRGDLHLDLPSIRCVGYRQTWHYLDGELSLAELKEQGYAATRQLAKRQITWLRALENKQVIDCLSDQAQATVVDLFAQALEQYR